MKLQVAQSLLSKYNKHNLEMKALFEEIQGIQEAMENMELPVQKATHDLRELQQQRNDMQETFERLLGHMSTLDGQINALRCIIEKRGHENALRTQEVVKKADQLNKLRQVALSGFSEAELEEARKVVAEVETREQAVKDAFAKILSEIKETFDPRTGDPGCEFGNIKIRAKTHKEAKIGVLKMLAKFHKGHEHARMRHMLNVKARELLEEVRK